VKEFISLLLALSCALAQEPLTNEAVLRMVKAGLGEDVIVGTINRQASKFSLATDDLITLKQAGVPDHVISAMMSAIGPSTQRTREPSEIALHNGTPVKLRLSRNLSSADAKTGETIDFEVLEEVKADDVLLIARGATALGSVTRAEKKKRMARGGKLDVTIDYVRLVNGDKAALRGVRETSGGGHTGAMTGAIVATAIVVWPAAPFFLFMHGKDTTIPKGTEITAYINGETKLDRGRLTASR